MKGASISTAKSATHRWDLQLLKNVHETFRMQTLLLRFHTLKLQEDADSFQGAGEARPVYTEKIQ